MVFLDSPCTQLTARLCIHFRLSAMLCIRIANKLFVKIPIFERARNSLLQFYASGGLQRNGNNHNWVLRYCECIWHRVEQPHTLASS